MNARPDSRTKLTFGDHARTPQDGRRYEIIDGELIVNPSPALRHQDISRHIQFQLYQQLELTGRGYIYNAPIAVELSKHCILEPDLVIVLSANKRVLHDLRILGVPDLIVEILSPSSIRCDRIRKRDIYEQHGVPEYWIVDPAAERVEQLTLRDGCYEVVGEHHDVFECATMRDVKVVLTDVWKRISGD